LGLKSTLLIFFGKRRLSAEYGGHDSRHDGGLGQGHVRRDDRMLGSGIDLKGRRRFVGQLVTRALGLWAGGAAGVFASGRGSLCSDRGLGSRVLAALSQPATAHAFGGRDRIELAQLEWQNGMGATSAEGSGASLLRPDALRRLLWEIEKRTAIEVNPEAVTVRLSDLTELHRHPLLYWSGDRAFPMPSDEELARLRRYLVMGGMLIFDSAEGRAGGGFDQSVRALCSRLFPNRPLSRLSEEHVLFRAFYLLRVPAGRIIAEPHIEAVLLGDSDRARGAVESPANPQSATGTSSSRPSEAKDRTNLADRAGRAVIVYSQNDLGGAWARDRFGQWVHDVVPGGETQREHAFRLGVNLAMYALCLDYKADQVHVPFIMRRRMWQAPAPKINFEDSTRTVPTPPASSAPPSSLSEH